mgnify:CR=1 FL=1
MKRISILLLLAVFSLISQAQNIAITDDNGYSADNSAMLDIKSNSKGVLIPRLTSSQRTSISNPANGLLVYDTNDNSFYFYTNGNWINLIAEGDIWSKSGNYIYTSDTINKVGVGTKNPLGKLEVIADPSISPEEPIFEVLNAVGDTVFAVYPHGVRIYVSEEPAVKASGNRGGFAVGGFSPAKGEPQEYFRVTRDSVRVYIDDDYIDAKASGSKGGFAVGGFSTAKGDLTNNYLFVQDDSSRVWTNSTGGFEIRDWQMGSANYLDLTPDNYFIGHESGMNTYFGYHNCFIGYQSGKENLGGSYNSFVGYQAGLNNQNDYNSFFGYKSGMNNANGTQNTFMGFESGVTNSSGNYNTFLGNEAGHNNTIGGYNVFIGHQAGYSNTDKQGQIFIGYKAGTNTITGDDNTFLGNEAGRMNSSGSDNTYIGSTAGSGCNGSYNVFLGSGAGYQETGSHKLYIANDWSQTSVSALIYGEFDNQILRVNNKLGIGKYPVETLDVNGGIRIGTTSLSNAGTIRWTGTNFEGYNGSAWLPFYSYWTQNGTDIFYNNGNIGIGTNSPGNKLAVYDLQASNDNPAIHAAHNVTDNYGVAIKAESKWKTLWAITTNDATGSAYGLYANSSGTSTADIYGVYTAASGTGTGSHIGIYASASGSGTNYAGFFSGNVHVNGTLSKSAGSFKIDHPQDPENKYLSHSFVESPDMKNVYDGTVILDSEGRATITLPGYFEALNKDFRYQLTSIGAYAPIYIDQEISNNQFSIAGGTSGMKVCWQVTGSRKDPYAVQHPIIVEEDKPQNERGKYLNPELYNEPGDKGIINATDCK